MDLTLLKVRIIMWGDCIKMVKEAKFFRKQVALSIK
jgi:hypothetical protein